MRVEFNEKEVPNEFLFFNIVTECATAKLSATLAREVDTLPYTRLDKGGNITKESTFPVITWEDFFLFIYSVKAQDFQSKTRSVSSRRDGCITYCHLTFKTIRRCIRIVRPCNSAYEGNVVVLRAVHDDDENDYHNFNTYRNKA